MPENYYSLSQITGHLQKLISKTYTQEYWIKAEIAQLNYTKKSGHCYPDLVEKSESGVKSQIRGTIWRGAYTMIQEKFQATTGRQLSDGMEILFRARVDYNPNFGLSLQISDIDPNFTLGKMAAEKLQSINKLKSDGVFFSNKALPTPFLPKRIALISVETSKGFNDFKNIIDNNTRGYKFLYMLFPALLQGDGAAESIGFQLERIRKVKHHFDLVAIIRGGGGDVGLSCYNDYQLARLVATFPLPVFTGIGHSTNETVVESVAHINAITPTDLAYYLQERFDNIAVSLVNFHQKLNEFKDEILSLNNKELQKLGERIIHRQSIYLTNKADQIEISRQRLLKYGKKYVPVKREILTQKSIKLTHLPMRRLDKSSENLIFFKTIMAKISHHALKYNWQKLHHQEEKVKILDPVEVLKKGFSITRIDGKAITDASALKPDSIIETTFAKGKVKSKTM